mgnify:CR=1 FL=1
MAHSIIVEVGALVPECEPEKVLILYGPKATAELREICVIHEFEKHPNQTLEVGKEIVIAGQKYTIQQVGSEANKNLEELGHISIYFKQNEHGLLPGAIEVIPEVFPTINVGDKLEF